MDYNHIPFYLTLSLRCQYCSNMNKCYCDNGWGGSDCSLAIQVTTHSPTQMPASSNTTLSMKRNEVIYGKTDLCGHVVVLVGFGVRVSLCCSIVVVQGRSLGWSGKNLRGSKNQNDNGNLYRTVTSSIITLNLPPVLITATLLQEQQPSLFV